MSFRRNYKEKLKLASRAGLEASKASVHLFNSVSKKNRSKII